MMPMTIRGVFTPSQPWVDLHSDSLMWHDKARQDWVGHSVKWGDDYFVVDRVEDRGDGLWRLHLIMPEVGA